jgi:HSP20 family protein
MAIIRFDPFRGFESLSRRMSQLASDFEKGLTIDYGSFAPRVDISEDEKKLYFHVELPGIAKEDVKVSINNDNVLMIKGEKKREERFEDKAEDKCFLRVERVFGAFTRSFALPENINTDSISAKYENGVLNIELDKKEPEKPKEVLIEIK